MCKKCKTYKIGNGDVIAYFFESKKNKEKKNKNDIKKDK
jgi:hypothetical protein